MTVAASILLAALVGGIVFVLLDSWQRRDDTPSAPEPQTEPLPQWSPEPRTEPLWEGRDDDAPPQPGLWSGWSR